MPQLLLALQVKGAGDRGPGVRLRKAGPHPDSIPADQLNASNDE
jgi:hypothetical protein